MSSPVKHSLGVLSVAAIGCVTLAASALMTACEPVGNGVAPREPAPREPAPPPPPPQRDPMDDPYDPGPGTQPGTQPGTP